MPLELDKDLLDAKILNDIKLKTDDYSIENEDHADIELSLNQRIENVDLSISTVGKSNNYNDLDNKPTIPDQITNINQIPTRSYNDLQDLPDLSKKADLIAGVVPTNQLPSYVDDVIEVADITAETTGETGKIYVDLTTEKTYRWTGSLFVEVSSQIQSDFSQTNTNAPDFIKNKPDFWKTTGNTNTDPNVNFIGTTDAKELVFKVNNRVAGYLGFRQQFVGYSDTLFGTDNRIGGQNVIFGSGNIGVTHDTRYSVVLGNGNLGNDNNNIFCYNVIAIGNNISPTGDYSNKIFIGNFIEGYQDPASNNDYLAIKGKLDVYKNVTFRLLPNATGDLTYTKQLVIKDDGTVGTIISNVSKVSLIVDRGVDVTMDNLKIRVSATGNVAAQISTISGTASIVGSTTSHFESNGVSNQIINLTATTTPQALSTYGFTTAGSNEVIRIINNTTNRSYLVTIIYNNSFYNNSVTIERLN